MSECEAALREAVEILCASERDWTARLGGADIAVDEARINCVHTWWDVKQAQDRLAELLHREAMAEQPQAPMELSEPALSKDLDMVLLADARTGTLPRETGKPA